MKLRNVKGFSISYTMNGFAISSRGFTDNVEAESVEDAINRLKMHIYELPKDDYHRQCGEMIYIRSIEPFSTNYLEFK